MSQYIHISFDQLKQLFPDLPATVGEENVQYTIVNHGQEVQLNNVQLGNLQLQENVRQGSISNNCISVVKADNLNGQYSLALKDDNPDPNNFGKGRARKKLFLPENVNSSSNSSSVHVKNSESQQVNHQAISTDTLTSDQLQTIYITTSAAQPVAPAVTYISVQPADVNDVSETSEIVSEPPVKTVSSSLPNEGEVQMPMIAKSLAVNKENQLSLEGKHLEETEEVTHGSVLSTAQVQTIQNHFTINRPTSQTESKRPATQLIALSLPSATSSPISPVRQIHANSQLSTTQVSLPNGQQISLQEYRRMNPQINSIQTCKGWGRGGTLVRQTPRGRRGSRRGSSVQSPIRLSSPTNNLTPGRVIVLDQRGDGEPMQFLVRNDTLQGNIDQEHQPAQLAGRQGSDTSLHLAQYEQSDEPRQLVMLVPSGGLGEHQLVTVTVPGNDAESNVSLMANPENSARPIARFSPKNKFCSPTGAVTLSSVPKRSIGLEGVVEQTSSGSFVSAPVLSKHNLEERKLVPGKVAHCQYCGYHSEDFNRCERCRRKVPLNCKEMPITHSKIIKDGIPSQKFYKGIREGVMTDNMPKPERSPRVRKPRKQFEEPVILTISSDEDEETEGKNDASAREAQANSFETENGSVMSMGSVMEPILPPLSSLSAFEKEPVIKESECSDPGSDEEQSVTDAIAAGVQEMQNGLTEGGNKDSRPVYLTCRTVRIGSYKAVPRERVIICKQGVRICVPDIEDGNKSVTITFRLKHIRKALIHFGRAMPVIFLYTTYPAGVRIRSTLNMTSKRGPYYDPCSLEETQKRITLLPERMTEDTKSRLKALFSAKDLLGELDNKEANDILVRASPKEVQETIKKTVAASPAMIGLRSSKDYFQKILIYPPPPAKGGITINPEDYLCLGEDQFLNDVIIDFYLKYLTQSCLSEEDQARTHVFSSFFYKRLTTRPVRSARRHHPMELDSTTTPAEKRHARVKSWTKNVDIFEKDFIVIPINESAHWFLAIICFPGLEGCVRMRDGVPVKLPPPQPKPNKKHKETHNPELENQEMQQQACLVKPIQIGSTTITPITSPIKGPGSNVVLSTPVTVDEKDTSMVVDDFSDRDEAEGEEEDIQMPSESEDEAQQEGRNEEEKDDETKEKSDKGYEEGEVEGKIKVKDFAKEGESETKEDNEMDNHKATVMVKSETESENEPGTSKQESAKIKEELSDDSNVEYCSPSEPIKQPCILIFDSLAGSSRSRVVATLRDYLRIEYKVKKGEEREFSKDTIRGACPRVPQQTNFVDCGVYVLQYVESFFESPIKDYRIPIRSLTQWFPEEVANRKREAIHELILKLMKEQNVTVRLPKITLPSPNRRTNQLDEREDCLKNSMGEMDMCRNIGEQSQIIIKTDQLGQRVVTGGLRVLSMCKFSDGVKLVLEPPNENNMEQSMGEHVLYEDIEEKVGGMYDSEQKTEMIERMVLEEGEEEEEPYEDDMEPLEDGEIEEEKKMEGEDWVDDYDADEEDVQLKSKNEMMEYNALVSPSIMKRKSLRHDVMIEAVKSEVSGSTESPNKKPKC